MRFTQHPSNNLVLGAPAGWDQAELPCGALPVTVVNVQGQRGMVSFWEPTAEEVMQLVNGAKVSLCIYGAAHPPVSVWVHQP